MPVDKIRQKHYLYNLYGLIAVFLSMLPLLVTVNEGLTRVMAATPLYRLIQATIVPFEVKIVAAILYLLHIPSTYQADGLTVSGVFLQVTWNCLGWQSLLFLLVSLIIGLQGKYHVLSVAAVISIGLLGTFILNIARITIVVILAAFAPQVFRIVFHDFLAATMTLLWLGTFWWFSYRYVLEEA